jgi:two-component system chemotaxis response regulator CheB
VDDRAPSTRVLIVDDSAVMRGLLRSALASDASLEVAGTAVDGRAALAAVDDLQPDLILLDVEMPVMDGLRALRSLRERGCGVPIIMCSSLTQRGARVTLEALAAGASDYVAKPAGHANSAEAIRALASQLLPRIHAMTSPRCGDPFLSQAAPAPAMRKNEIRLPAPSIVVIGVSTGGPAALELLLPRLPADFPLPVLVAQHMPEVFTGSLAERLDARSALRVREAAEGDELCTGVVSIARGNWHLEVLAAVGGDRRPTLHLTQNQPENHCRPSVDILFRTSAAAFGSGVLAVVLTGMGTDGLAGARSVRSVGGIVLAQDQRTSAVWGMPGAVTRAGLAQGVLPIEAIAGEILRLVKPASPAKQRGSAAL